MKKAKYKLSITGQLYEKYEEYMLAREAVLYLGYSPDAVLPSSFDTSRLCARIAHKMEVTRLEKLIEPLVSERLKWELERIKWVTERLGESLRLVQEYERERSKINMAIKMCKASLLHKKKELLAEFPPFEKEKQLHNLRSKKSYRENQSWR